MIALAIIFSCHCKAKKNPASDAFNRLTSVPPITASNKASWALFTSIAAAYDAEMDRDAHFEEELHFDGETKTEHLVQIGPIRHRRLKQVA